MEISVKYDREEVYALVIEATVKQFGAAPEGYEWKASGSYGDVDVDLVKLKVSAPSPVIETPTKDAL